MISRRWGGRDNLSGAKLINHGALALVTGPAAEPVTLEEVRLALRIDYNYEDPYLEIVAKSARERVEKFLRRALITQTWDLILDWGPAWVELPKPPLQSVVGIYATGTDVTDITVDPGAYYVKDRVVSLRPAQVWPTHITPQGFRVRFTCGYGDDRVSVPSSIRMEILNLCVSIYDTRGLNQDIPDVTKQTLRGFRIEGEPWRIAKSIEPPELLA
jgi:uncharacterized phiE125 gp8 family phage protein